MGLGSMSVAENTPNRRAKTDTWSYDPDQPEKRR
jgi:hypothetical protein